MGIAFLLGFWGYLMIGNINLAVLELAKYESRAALTRFIAVLLIFEFIYCFGSLYFLQYLTIYAQVILIAKYTAVVLLVILGLWAILEKPKDVIIERKNIVIRGYWSAILHPQQIPFWLLWGVYLIETNVITNNVVTLSFFAAANVFGAFCMLMCYVRFGNKLISLIKLNLHIIKKFVGFLCLGTAAYMLYELLK